MGDHRNNEQWPWLKSLPWVAENAGVDPQRLRRWHMGHNVNFTLYECMRLASAFARAEGNARVLKERIEEEILEKTKR